MVPTLPIEIARSMMNFSDVPNQKNFLFNHIFLAFIVYFYCLFYGRIGHQSQSITTIAIQQFSMAFLIHLHATA